MYFQLKILLYLKIKQMLISESVCYLPKKLPVIMKPFSDKINLFSNHVWFSFKCIYQKKECVPCRLKDV
jgi:hypothetical protein